jgi:glycosyltransferase involved in cell wall biosynthesis
VKDGDAVTAVTGTHATNRTSEGQPALPVAERTGAGAASARRRVLMLCYLYPPILDVGTTRSKGFSRLLPEFGWDPTVLTVKRPRSRFITVGEPVPEDVAIVRSFEVNVDDVASIVHGVIDRILRLFGKEVPGQLVRDLMCIPDPQVLWLSIPAGLKLARTHDAIYVSCSPFSAALSGCVLKRLTGLPLVVDFRDAWSLNPHKKHVALHNMAVRRLERLVVKTCDALIMNTDGAARLYAEHYPEFRHKIVALPNGFDALNLPTPEEAARTDTFRIMHFGTFYGNRNPGRLLEALARIGDPSVEFVHAGRPDACMERYAGKVRIRLLGEIPHAEALRTMRGASLLYLIQGEEEGIRDYIAVAQKTFDYLATGLPILAECPDGDNADVLRRSATRANVLTSGSVDDVEAALRTALTAWRSQPASPPEVSARFQKEFSRRNLTKRLALLLDSLVSRSSGS